MGGAVDEPPSDWFGLDASWKPPLRELPPLRQYEVCTSPDVLPSALQPFFESSRLAVDVERYQTVDSQQPIALLQLSSDETHLVIDPFAIPDLSSLGPLLKDPKRLVVLHSAFNDLYGLWHEFSLETGTFLDTRELAVALGLTDRELGLAALVRRSFGFELDKSLQTADWEQRPLPRDMLDYASRDSQLLLPLIDRLVHEAYFGPCGAVEKIGTANFECDGGMATNGGVGEGNVRGKQLLVQAFTRSSVVQAKAKILRVGAKKSHGKMHSRNRERRQEGPQLKQGPHQHQQHDNEHVDEEVSLQGRRQPRKVSSKFCASTLVYGNISLLDPTGGLMCRISARKRDWYLSRGLAEAVSETELRLKFIPKGPGHAGSDLYLTERENQCVICGTGPDVGSKDPSVVSVGLLRHYVVPFCYRRNLPEVYKSHSPFDIVLSCAQCKARANVAADELKAVLAAEHGAPIDGKGHVDITKLKAAKAARVLSQHRCKMPEHRACLLEDTIRAALDMPAGSAITEEHLQEAVAAGQPGENFESHGVMIVASIGDAWPGFVVRWRQHFISTSCPRFLPQGWEADVDWREVAEVDLEPSRMAAWAASHPDAPQQRRPTAIGSRTTAIASQDK